MVKTHLPAHMDSVRQNFRPKHQLLILKCYPRLPKNSAADVKPNGSELSYLLYYASTRRSKLHKVGSFLERKTASDVSRWQSARVLVTLQILTALLENKAVGAGSGFALFAPYVLRIIRQILQNTNDLSLIEASLETWDTFCRHQDLATLKADHEYRELYEDVVRRYAAFAKKEGGKKLGKNTQPVAIQDALRLREAGLSALKSVVVSDALASESGRQLDVAVPAILSNMRGDNGDYLTNLLRLRKQGEQDDKEKAMTRRMSMAAARTHTGFTDGSFEADPRQAEGTADDADAFAEEEVAVLALDCLIACFSDENRPQMRSATTAVLRYLADLHYRPGTRGSGKPAPNFTTNTWATKLFEICTAWTPVQDRFVILVTAVETLVRLPLKDSDMQQHLLYTDLIDHILRSDLNLIGLSVMDILLGLVQQVLRVLQLSGPRAAGRGSATQLFSNNEQVNEADRSLSDVPSEERVRLTERLKLCISDLATHVYYTDQISDMIAAILLRLKPNPAPTGQQNPVITAAAIEEPVNALTEVATNISLPARDRPSTSTSGYFSFETARQIALESVRDILLVSTSARSFAASGVAESRNRVPISIWEGTQWLLRDPSATVQRAYVDALTTWLKLETNKADLRVKEPKDKAKKKPDTAFARRAISNASQKKDKQSKKATTTFLQLLHLAVFENALQFAGIGTNDNETEEEGEEGMLVLNYLLATLVLKLGVNAVQSGLPMIFALQEEIGKAKTLVAKVRLGSLVHGYLWVLAEIFDFDASFAGKEIFAEIKIRQEQGLWIKDLTMPPRTLDQIAARPGSSAGVGRADVEAINPFQNRQGLIDRIADSYSASVTSPTPSAPGSPGRSPTQRRLSVNSPPTLDRTASSYLTAKHTMASPLPEKVRATMMETWTKEGCLAAIASAAPKSVSLTGSKSSPSQALATGNHRQLLAAVNTGPTARNSSPLPPGQQYGVGQVAPPRQQALGSHLNSQSHSPDGRFSGSTNGYASSSAGAHGRVRVDDLKRVLAGGGFTTGYVRRVSDDIDDTISDSLVNVEGEDLGSDSGFVTPPSRLESHTDLPSLSVPQSIPEDAAIESGKRDFASAEPPYLRLPTDTVTDGQLQGLSSPAASKKQESAPNGNPRLSTSSQQRPPSSRGRASIRSKAGHSKKDLTALLAGVGSEGGASKEELKFTGLGRPPY